MGQSWRPGTTIFGRRAASDSVSRLPWNRPAEFLWRQQAGAGVRTEYPRSRPACPRKKWRNHHHLRHSGTAGLPVLGGIRQSALRFRHTCFSVRRLDGSCHGFDGVGMGASRQCGRNHCGLPLFLAGGDHPQGLPGGYASAASVGYAFSSSSSLSFLWNVMRLFRSLIVYSSPTKKPTASYNAIGKSSYSTPADRRVMFGSIQTFRVFLLST